MAGRREWRVEALKELRCVSTDSSSTVVKLVEGSAELFGVELAVNREYTFTESSFSIFTWYGCRIETFGSADYYIAAGPSMTSYVNAHIELESRRDHGRASVDKRGPRVLVIGPQDAGKTTLCRILGNYAMRVDRKPILVDLDITEGHCAIPGCVSAAPLERDVALSVEVISLLCNKLGS